MPALAGRKNIQLRGFILADFASLLEESRIMLGTGKFGDALWADAYTNISVCGGQSYQREVVVSNIIDQISLFERDITLLDQQGFLSARYSHLPGACGSSDTYYADALKALQSSGPDTVTVINTGSESSVDPHFALDGTHGSQYVISSPEAITGADILIGLPLGENERDNSIALMGTSVLTLLEENQVAVRFGTDQNIHIIETFDNGE